jgi:hypothetical protein
MRQTGGIKHAGVFPKAKIAKNIKFPSFGIYYTFCLSQWWWGVGSILTF